MQWKHNIADRPGGRLKADRRLLNAEKQISRFAWGLFWDALPANCIVCSGIAAN
jgi:hypothetical protein